MDQKAKIAEAGRRLRTADKQRGETTVGMRRQHAADIGRACGLSIESPGDEGRPNATVEAIIAAAEAARQDK